MRLFSQCVGKVDQKHTNAVRTFYSCYTNVPRGHRHRTREPHIGCRKHDQATSAAWISKDHTFLPSDSIFRPDKQTWRCRLGASVLHTLSQRHISRIWVELRCAGSPRRRDLDLPQSWDYVFALSSLALSFKSLFHCTEARNSRDLKKKKKIITF